MSVFLSQSDLSRGDLRLFLTNDLGYKIDPFSVKWTILSDDGKRVSGNRLPAVRYGTGDYYAPWHACARGGCHKIVWDYLLQPGLDVQRFTESFFIIDPNRYDCCIPSSSSDWGVDAACMTFLVGNQLGRGDLSLYLKDLDGIPVDAYAVTWKIVDHHGCAIALERNAIQIAVGEYYADWFVSAQFGEYQIQWKVIETIDSPAELFVSKVFVINPCSSVQLNFVERSYSAPIERVSCSTSYVRAPYISCSESIFVPNVPPMIINNYDFEILRIIHLSEQNLPVGGAFTAQLAYNIPSRIRRISFYVRYRRNLAGGRASLKLLWGNGVEEANSTLIDEDIVTTLNTSTQNMLLSIYNGPIPVDDNVILFQIETIVPGGAKTVRLLAAESGQPMTPGIIEITLTAST